MALVTLGGKALLLAGAALTYGAGGSSTPTVAGTLNVVAGTLQAWDPTVPGNVLAWNAAASDKIGAPLTSWADGSAAAIAAGVTDGTRLKSVTQVTSYAGVNAAIAVPTEARARPRVNGAIAALGGKPGSGNTDASTTSPSGLWPQLDPNQCWVTEAPITLAASQPWAIALAYARPHVRMRDGSLNTIWGDATLVGFGTLSAYSALLTVTSDMPATASGAGTSVLKCLGTTLKSGLYPSYWGTALLVNVPGAGITAYVDGSSTPAATGIALPGTWPTTAAPLSALGACSPSNGGQCYLHEMSVIGPVASASTISADQITSALTALARYRTGKAPTVMFTHMGQSNAGNLTASGSLPLARALIAYQTGALACDFVKPPYYAVAAGRQLYGNDNGGVPDNTSYLRRTTVATGAAITDPALYEAGDTLNSLLITLDALPPYLKGCLAGIYAYYGEAASTSTEGTGTPYDLLDRNVGAWKNFAGKIRAWQLTKNGVTETPASLPILFAEMASYGVAYPSGAQMVAEAYYRAAADGAGFVPVLASMMDVQDDGTAHIPAASLQTLTLRAASAISRAVLAGGKGDATVTMPSGAGGWGRLGPQITEAVWEPATKSVLVTVTHDAGTDLTLSTAAASQGMGFTLRPNWSSANSRGAIYYATSATKVAANQIRVYFAGTGAAALPLPLTASARLFYGEQGVKYTLDAAYAPTNQVQNSGAFEGRFGPGNAIYDNAGANLPGGFNPVADLGPVYGVNYALRWTPAGVPVTVT
jgi:hypothetical protein